MNYHHGLSIGNLKLSSNIFIAPLAGYTNLPTRMILRRQVNAMMYAEMISAEGLHYSFDKSAKLLDTQTADTPLGIQLFGASADRILNAFNKIKNEKFDLIDINCGCSVKKILKAESGACLLRTPETIYDTIKMLKNETDKPVTLKVRSGWDKESINFIDVLDAAESAKADLITLHARTRSMLFSGNADWEHIKIMKQKSSIPVIGNGDIFTGDDAVRMINDTGCDGIMLARGIIENPLLLSEVNAALRGEIYTKPTFKERLELALNHCSDFVKYYGEKRGIMEFRKFFKGYTKGIKDIHVLRQIVNNTIIYTEIKDAISNFIMQCSKSYR